MMRGSKSLSLAVSLFFISIALTGCPNNANQADSFPQPQVRRSASGVLQTQLNVAITENSVMNEAGTMDTVSTMTYEGGLIGPTFRLKQGDNLIVDLINNLPENPTQERTGAFPHARYTTNFHSHGLTTDPNGIADNVLRRMAPGTTSRIEIPIHDTHQTGTFWYHPHKHGAVSFQFFGGMAGFLIIEGDEGTLDQVPEVAAAQEILMGFQVIRTDQDGNVPFVNTEAEQANSDQGETNGLWGPYKDSNAYFTTNGEVNPTLHISPGQVIRVRMLNAAAGLTLPVALEGHSLNIIANDGLTVPEMQTLDEGQAYVLGAGNRVDVLIKAGSEGTYKLQALDPTTTPRSVSPSGIAPAPRPARVGLDFPAVDYPVTLATIVVSGSQFFMQLPSGELPANSGIPSTEEILNETMDAERNIAFELCGKGGQQTNPANRSPSCGWYSELYDAEYWGGLPFGNLTMMRDADDEGIPNPAPDPEMPRIDYEKEGLFSAEDPLFDDMRIGNFEEWTVLNRTFSDHPFHIHVNPFLLTHINGIELPVPEWRDTIIVPAATGNTGNINTMTPGSITFRTRFDPSFPGTFVMHCHILTHEDVGMMQRLDVIQ